LRALLTALGEGNAEAALDALHEAVAMHAEMKLFARLLLEALRAVILVRHQPKNAETLLAAFAPDTRETITALAGAKTSPINSHLLLRFLTATQEVTFSPLPHLPLEIAIIDVTTKA